MPDTGDEAARAAADVAFQFMKWTGHKAGEVFSNRSALVKHKTIIRDKTSRTNRGDLTTTIQTEEGEDIACLEVCAINEAELREMCAVLDSAHVEYAFELDSIKGDVEDLTLEEVKPDKYGLYHFWVPDRTPEQALEGYVRFEEAPDAIQKIVFENTKAKAFERLAFYKALESLEDKWEFSVDSPIQGDLSFDFKTTVWDRGADTLKKAFDSAGIAYTFTHLSDAMVHFDIPAKHSKDAAFVISDLIAKANDITASRFTLQNNSVDLEMLADSYEKALEHQVFYEALDNLKGKWEFSADSPIQGDLSFDFETIAWDRDANLLKNAFDSADVAYTFTRYSDMVHFEVPAKHSKNAAFVISDLIATVNGMSAERFTLQSPKNVDLEELVERDVLLKQTVIGEKTYIATCRALDATDVSYEAAFDEEANIGTFTLSASDLAVHGWNLPNSSEEIKEILAKRQASDARPSQQKKIPLNFDLKEAKRSEAAERICTPARDAQHAIEVQRLTEQTTTQKHNPVQRRGR